MCSLCSSVREGPAPIVSKEETAEQLAVSKRNVAITTLVLALLLAASYCLLFCSLAYPIGPMIPNTTMPWVTILPMVGCVGLTIGFLISFIKCVDIHKWLVNPHREKQLEEIGLRIRQLEADLEEVRSRLQGRAPEV